MTTNTYPNPENYPTPSFTVPVQSPDVDPDAGDLISASFNPAWIPVLVGALDQLLLPSTWEGTDEEKILALNRATNLKDILGSADVPMIAAPYWDDENDIDDEEPKNEQSWYGHYEDNTFIEDVGTTIVAGFLAQLVSPQAAIFYRTFEKRFRLAFIKEGPAGFVRVIVDNASDILYDLANYDSDIVEIDVMGDPELEMHEFLVINESAP